MTPTRYVALASLLTVGCSEPPAKPGTSEPAPAVVTNRRTEADLSTITLTEQAVTRLGIETVAVTTDSAASTRTLGGEVVVPTGRSVVVTAPVAGTLMGLASAQPGARVRRGERLMTLSPFILANRDQRIEAQRQVAAAESEERVSRQRLQRLEQLLKDGAASIRGVEEARAQHEVTQSALAAARERLAAVAASPVTEQGEFAVSAPVDGVVQNVSAVPGQTVGASAPLVEIAQLDTVWIRVAVYAGDADRFDERRPVAVRKLGATGTLKTATRVAAPPRGDPAAASVDAYYALADEGAQFRPGERVLVEIPLKGTEKGLVVPEAAVLYDIHGTAWVYEDLGGHAYARRRIQIARHAGDRVVVSRGISEGVKVVTAGAAELFGTEFGAGH